MATLGGAMIPQFVMPSWVLTMGHISPVKMAFSLAEMVLPCVILIGFGTVCFAVGVRGLREA